MKKIALFLSIVVAAIACDKVDPVTPPEFDFANPDVLVPYQGSEDENLKLEFTTNVDWTAELDQTYDWVTITPKSGKAGEAAITVIATPNNEAEVRSAVITVKAGVSVLVFDVVQEAYPALSIDPTEVEFDAAGGTQEVTVDATVEYVVTFPENEWLTYDYNAETGVYTLTAAANEGFAERSLTIVLSNNVDGVSESVVVSQRGRVTVLWEKALADYSQITPGGPLRLAYKDGMLALSTGAAVHVLSAADGAYMMPVELPAGMVSLTNDDAGNIVIAANAPEYGSSDVYAISSLETMAPVKVATISNAALYRPGGNLRAGGDVTKNGVLTMYVDYEHYWIGCDIVDGVAQESTFEAIKRLDGAGSTWDPNAGCATPLGSKLADGVLATFYTQPALVSNASGEWTQVGAAIFSGNDNNCAIAEAVYGDTHFAAVAVGSHFNYSATGLYLYDLATSEMVYSYRIDGDLVNAAGATADAVLVPTDDALLMYYADLQKGKIVCIEVK